MATIADGVEFDKVAREWRCKWSPDDDKKSLVEAQKALESVLSDVKSVDGVQSVERIVCGGCLDFKVVTTLSGTSQLRFVFLRRAFEGRASPAS